MVPFMLQLTTTSVEIFENNHSTVEIPPLQWYLANFLLITLIVLTSKRITLCSQWGSGLSALGCYIWNKLLLYIPVAILFAQKLNNEMRFVWVFLLNYYFWFRCHGGLYRHSPLNWLVRLWVQIKTHQCRRVSAFPIYKLSGRVVVCTATHPMP